MIYFIQCGKNGPIKIGQTDNNVQDRVKQLQTGCPYELNVLWIYHGDEYTESSIHEIFQHERMNGEWFHPSEKLFKFIELKLANGYDIYSQNNNDPILLEEFSQEFIL